MKRPSIHKIKKADCLGGGALPPEWGEDLLPAIQERVNDSRRKIVVLDDDPTGTQTVHGIPVLTQWSTDVLAAELQSEAKACYLLTNSRSLAAPQARRLATEIGERLRAASRETNTSVAIISRSDSTLRGHFPDEVDALAEAMGTRGRPYLIIPCFFEGRRYTVKDVHYVGEGEWLIPAAETAYARDAAFGYTHSNLPSWVEEKTGGRITREQVATISLEDIRNGGPRRVRQILEALNDGAACVVNAVAYRDLEVFVLGLLDAEQSGKRFLFRTAASFVRVRAGIAPRALLAKEELVSGHAGGGHGGLFIVGSYVPKTTDQVTHLRSQADIRGIEIDVDRLLDDAKQTAEIDRVSEEMNRLIAAGGDVLICTSRRLVTGADAVENLSIGRRVSDSLIRIVRALRVQPRYLVAKGGITSSDVATRGLGVSRAMVMGQILPGVPVWRLEEESRYPGMAYVVFPGNVGAIEALAGIRDHLRRRPTRT